MDTPVSSVAGLPAPTVAPYFQQVDPVAVPETVNKMRLRRGYTLAQVSEYVGKQKSWASKIEKGKLPLRGTDLEAFASILDVPLKSLLKVTGVSRRDLELVIGVDNSIIGAADGRPTLGLVR